VSDLKPCPACGMGAQHMEKPRRWHRVTCAGGCISTDWMESAGAAAIIWNSLPRRADFAEPELEMRPGQMITMGPDRERMRFEAAVAAMQGMMAAGEGAPFITDDIPSAAVRLADALLAELAKEKP
jgi:hypothetical protein